MPPARKSIVWSFFTKSFDKKFVTCRLCRRTIKYFASTSNLRQHVMRKHPTEFEEQMNNISQNNSTTLDESDPGGTSIVAIANTENHFVIVESLDVPGASSSDLSSQYSLKRISRSESTEVPKQRRQIEIFGEKNTLNVELPPETSYGTLFISVPYQFVYHVSLNRPEKRNAINENMWIEITKCFNELSQDEDCRVIVLSGAGKLFTTGIDFEDLIELSSIVAAQDDVAHKAKIYHNFIAKYQNSITSLELCKKPVLAAVHSACIGAGVDIITAADMRYCTRDAWFQVNGVDIGMAPDAGTLQRLPKVIGSDSLARELCYTARKMQADEALRSGLVSKVFIDEQEMLQEVFKIAETIARKSPVAVQGTKTSIVYSRDHPVQESLQQIALWSQLMMQSEDFAETTSAQVNKGKNVEFSKL